jgi:outer membrane protein assembly factor BamA
MMEQQGTRLCFNYLAVSFLKLLLLTFISAAGISSMAQTQSSVNRSKVKIDAVELEGTHLSEAAQEQLVTSLKQHEWNEDSNWVADLERMVVDAETDGWPERENQGYVGFSVSAGWKPLRREPGVLHVQVTICVNEGHQKRLEKIELRYGAQSPVFTPNELRKLFPLNDGDIYNRDKYFAGLSAVEDAYAEEGFIDLQIYPTIKVDDVNQTVALLLDITEGLQYRWGNIQVVGLDPKIEKLLRSLVTTDNPANRRLIQNFYEEYKSLLPLGASPKNVKWHPDAQLGIVDLTFDFSSPAAQSVHD